MSAQERGLSPDAATAQLAAYRAEAADAVARFAGRAVAAEQKFQKLASEADALRQQLNQGTHLQKAPELEELCRLKEKDAAAAKETARLARGQAARAEAVLVRLQRGKSVQLRTRASTLAPRVAAKAGRHDVAWLWRDPPLLADEREDKNKRDELRASMAVPHARDVRTWWPGTPSLVAADPGCALRRDTSLVADPGCVLELDVARPPESECAPLAGTAARPPEQHRSSEAEEGQGRSASPPPLPAHPRAQSPSPMEEDDEDGGGGAGVPSSPSRNTPAVVLTPPGVGRVAGSSDAVIPLPGRPSEGKERAPDSGTGPSEVSASLLPEPEPAQAPSPMEEGEDDGAGRPATSSSSWNESPVVLAAVGNVLI